MSNETDHSTHQTPNLPQPRYFAQNGPFRYTLSLSIRVLCRCNEADDIKERMASVFPKVVG